MTRRSRQAVVAGVVMAVACGALVAVVRSAGTGDPAAAITPTADSAGAMARRSACEDVLLVGVDGNHEQPKAGERFGPTVARYAEPYYRAISKRRTVTATRLAFNAPALTALTAKQRGKKTAANSIRKVSLRTWTGPVADGVNALVAKVGDALTDCPEQQVVLVGHAQGARVVHQAARKLLASSYADRITAVVLVSDPTRQAHTVATHLTGDPQAPRRLPGIETRVRKPRPDVPAATPTFATWDVCSQGDLVCAPGRVALGPAVTTAKSYRHKSAAVAEVRKGIVAQTRLWPTPKPAVQVQSADQGEAFQLPLKADVDASARDGVRWTATSGLPDGVTLSEDGLLAGTPTASGTFTISYSVAGTDPVTTGHTGTVTLSVAPSATSISAGGQVSCVTDGDGRATCSGTNQFGQLGNGTTTSSSVPVKVKGKNWAKISTSGSTTCGIKKNGKLWCWGLNNFNQLGIGQSGPRVNPQKVAPGSTWKTVRTSWFHTCAVRSDDKLLCWGQNMRGQIGTGGKKRIVQKPRVVTGGAAAWADVATGGYYTCGVGTDGSLWCWGQNTLGQLGNTESGLHPTPMRVGTDSDWVQVDASWAHSCAVSATGRLWCWGLNDSGQLGVGDRRNWWRPQSVAPAQIWTAVTTGDASTCALDGNGRPWCWGADRYGELGSGNSATKVPSRVGNDQRLSAIDAGWMHVCGLTGSSRTCWGSNETGQLGIGNTGSRTARTAPSDSADDVLTPKQRARQRAILAHGQRMRKLSVAQQVRREIGDRPAVPPAARTAARKSVTTKVMTFNLLGSNHTSPSGDRKDWAPGRIRSEWASALVAARDGALVGIQEIQPDQVTSLGTATDNQYTFWPGNALGYPGAPQSLMWRSSEWKAVWKDSVTIPFMRTQSRPQPVVRLQNLATGQQLYMLNAHLSPGKMEADRKRGTKLLIATIKELQGDGLPILLTGDFNDHHDIFCKVVRQTELVAALGGSATAKTCTVPPKRRVDWIFGSRGTFGTVSISQGALVRRTTDHAIQDVSFTVQ